MIVVEYLLKEIHVQNLEQKKKSLIVQGLEHMTVNHVVIGSSPI